MTPTITMGFTSDPCLHLERSDNSRASSIFYNFSKLLKCVKIPLVLIVLNLSGTKQISQLEVSLSPGSSPLLKSVANLQSGTSQQSPPTQRKTNHRFWKRPPPYHE